MKKSVPMTRDGFFSVKTKTQSMRLVFSINIVTLRENSIKKLKILAKY